MTKNLCHNHHAHPHPVVIEIARPVTWPDLRDNDLWEGLIITHDGRTSTVVDLHATEVGRGVGLVVEKLLNETLLVALGKLGRLPKEPAPITDRRR